MLLMLQIEFGRRRAVRACQRYEFRFDCFRFSIVFNDFCVVVGDDDDDDNEDGDTSKPTASVSLSTSGNSNTRF